MTLNDIYEFFKDDERLMDYFDPLSTATNNKEAAFDIYQKLIDYSKDYKCEFIKMDCGYIYYIKPRWFFQRKKLISFCIKPEYRTAYWKAYFWNKIKRILGNRFTCCLFNKNTRAINYLIKNGMRIKESNNLITFLYI